MASFGVRLKQEREQRGITLEEISQSTKIGTRLLQALEQDHFDQLPGGIFNKGFIRAYARCLGLDEEQAIADYLAASGNLASEKGKDKKSDGPSDVSSFELLG
ncbi:MAG: helix-turn-helix transcriptional regulator, partial [Terriglobales bacterium]